jgi:hypothetical protein
MGRRKWRVWPLGATASVSGRDLLVCFSFSFFELFVGGSPAPSDLRTAHLRRAEETCVTNFFASAVLL